MEFLLTHRHSISLNKNEKRENKFVKKIVFAVFMELVQCIPVIPKNRKSSDL